MPTAKAEPALTEAVAEALADQVRSGVGLCEAIGKLGLDQIKTTAWLQKNHRALLKDAKAEQRAANAQPVDLNKLPAVAAKAA